MAGNYITGAAIIGGELVLSLSTGEILNCGLVSGPPGDRGIIGPMGPSGRDGADGLSMRTGTGFPDSTIGVDGEVFYSTTLIAVFVKSGGTWGAPVYLKPKGIETSTGQRIDKKTAGSGSGSRFMMGGGPMMGGPASPQTAGLDQIIGDNLPLAANTLTTIVNDNKGYVFHVLIHGLAADGSEYSEVICTRDEQGNTAHVVAWETELGTTPPNLTFATSINGNQLELAVSSDIALTKIRGKICWI